MLIIEAVFLVVSIVFVVFLAVKLATSDNCRATNGFALAMSINTIVDVVIKSLK